ncbi:MAG: aminotransferase class I/II-fold pyridoxal phosphate-dependent enzyme, partial [Actinomycetota bacterium]|nr:aminotransferase class I/II-fold pyridoxal phosphate-dependent enzyme [Actinomycetota bacterium]
RQATELRQAISEHHGVQPDQVFCANGSNEVLQCLFLAYGGPGRAALVFEPTYALHSHIARLTGTGVVRGERTAAFAVDGDLAKELLSASAAQLGEREPSITLLCSPNNPTGNSETRSTVEDLAGAVPGLLVVDEAYGQFSSWSAIDLVRGGDPAVAVVRTFSKTWAMAALRLGYLVTTSEVVKACSAVSLPYHLDAFKQQAGTLALRHEPEMRARVARLVEQRGRLLSALFDLSVEAWPSDANFVLFRVPGCTAGEVWQRLVDQSVLVRDVSGWPRLEGCLRVTVGTAEENGRFLEALGRVLRP